MFVQRKIEKMGQRRSYGDKNNKKKDDDDDDEAFLQNSLESFVIGAASFAVLKIFFKLLSFFCWTQNMLKQITMI